MFGPTAGHDGLEAGAAVRTDASTQYFQRLLIDSASGSSQPFGTALAGIGLDGRQLQAMPIDQAYSLAHDAAMKVEDITARRRYLLELFNETER